VAVNGHRQGLLRLLLADDVLVEDFLDLRRRRNLSDRLRDFPLFVLRENLVTECDALVAYVH
jgi:hypothetical protein